MNKLKRHGNRDEKGLAHGRGYVYSIEYHIVWATKYCKPVLINQTAETCKLLLLQAAEETGTEITAMEVMPDHVHLLVSASPQTPVPDMIKILKGNSARRMFVKHPELKQELYGGHLWNPSYCIVTASDRTREQITHYIQTQHTR